MPSTILSVDANAPFIKCVFARTDRCMCVNKRHAGFLPLLAQLTTVGEVSEAQFSGEACARAAHTCSLSMCMLGEMHLPDPRPEWEEPAPQRSHASGMRALRGLSTCSRPDSSVTLPSSLWLSCESVARRAA